MKNLLSDINQVDGIIRELQKIESKLLSGQFIRAYRDVCKILAVFQNHRQEILKEADKT